MAFPFHKVVLEPKKAVHYLYYYFRYYTLLLRRGRRYVRITGEMHGRPYLSWKVFRVLGLTESRERGALAYHHIDKTWCEPAPISAINGRCTDVSKTTVARAFEEAFGYPLLVQNPETFHGALVAKSEVNARHDGVVLEGPVAERQEGVCYQKLIDTRMEDGNFVELRTTVVGDEIPQVIERVRSGTERSRFRADAVIRATLRQSREVFSAEEERNLIAMSRSLHLDIGDLDILRDRNDGRIYVVDVSKTVSASIPSTVSWDGIAKVERVAESFERQFCRPAEPTQGASDGQGATGPGGQDAAAVPEAPASPRLRSG